MPGTARPTPVTPQTPAGSGFSSCFLTWYDPALGGVNSSGGVANPHAQMANGKPYDPSAATCAAPPQYAFGTKILFVVGSKQVICEVTDRGGAITGSHFDLSRWAAWQLGVIPSFGYTGSAGSANGTFKVLPPGTATGHTTTAAGNAVNAAGQAISQAANAVTQPFQDLASVVNFLFSYKFLYIIGGGALVLVALLMIAKQTMKVR